MAMTAQPPIAPPAMAGNMWQSGICGCFDNGAMCCQTCVCHICTASAVYARESYNLPVGCDCGTCCLLWCCSGPCFCCPCLPCNGGLTFSFLSGMRRTLVQRYGIQGESVCVSCLMAACCSTCSACQIQREMAARGQHSGGCCASAPPANNALPAPPPAYGVPLGGTPDADPAAKPQSGGDGTAQPAAAVVVVTATPAGPPPAYAWSSGLFDCAGGADCCEALCCWCCVLGFMSGKLNELRGIPGATGGQLDPAACLGSYQCECLYHFLMRRELIERYNIGGESPFMTYCCLCWCAPCTLAQSRREMGYRGEYPGGLCLKEAPARSG